MAGWSGIVDGGGITLMVVGMVVVFSALFLLMLLMIGLKRYQEFIHQRIQLRQRRVAVPGAAEVQASEDIPGVVVAAIALTLILEGEQVHDDETMVLTLRGIAKPYSSWWQGRIDPVWNAKSTKGKSTAMRTVDPVRGVDV